MVITWYGQSCFRIQSGKTTIIIDPFSKVTGLTPPKGEADILLVTHNHPDHNNVKAIAGSPFLVNGPGEYERSQVKIRGVVTYHDEKQGTVRGMNTAYLIDMEGIRVLHLGDLGEKTLSDEKLEALGTVDILMVPVGGVFTIDGEAAAGLTNSIEPKIVIPMHYKIPGLAIKLEDASQFRKAFGFEGQAVEKLTLRKNNLPEERMEVVVMRP